MRSRDSSPHLSAVMAMLYVCALFLAAFVSSIVQDFVGYWPTQNTVVVAHEGTDPTQLVSILTDVNILQDTLDTNLFPGVSSSVLVHDGFRNAHALTAAKILAEVKNLMASQGTQSVAVVSIGVYKQAMMLKL